MAEFEEQLQALTALDATVVAASVDTGEDSKKIAGTVSFQVAEGVTRDMANALGSWWEDRRSIIQPSEFVVDTATGEVLTSTYSSGPVGRIAAQAAVGVIGFYEKQRTGG
jgi:peroxiredoxin